MVITAFSSTEISIFRLIESYWFFFNSIIVLYVEDVLGTRGVVIIHFFLNQTDCTRPSTESIHYNALRTSHKELL
jgi:hypothetical protein